MVKVVKFGGSSLADAKQFRKVIRIIEAENDRKYVIPSAPGKRSPDDIKVTDMLYKCYEQASKGENISEIFSQITDRYNSIIKELGVDLDLSDEFESIRNSLAAREKVLPDAAAHVVIAVVGDLLLVVLPISIHPRLCGKPWRIPQRKGTCIRARI